ncbi:hypothetical protein [Vibrio phage vB_ValP_IME271]|nr:hypothetical protein [Vibrio phage vB_ValP_IME271]
MNTNMTLYELNSQFIIKHAIKSLKIAYLQLNALNVLNIEPSVEKQGYFNVTLGCNTTEKTYIITVSMKNSLEQLLNSLNLALETLTNR